MEAEAKKGSRLRRISVLAALVLALGLTCEVTSRSRADDPAPTSGATPAPPRAAVTGFDPAIAELGAPIESARDAILEGHFDEVRTAIGTASSDDAGVLRFRLARAYAAAGSADAALPIYREIVESGHPLALAARLEIGRIAPDLSAVRDEITPACDADWPDADDACALLALASAGESDEAERLDHALEGADGLAYEVRARLVVARATLLAAEEDDASRERAIEMLRGLADVRPSSSIAADADARALAIADTLPPRRRRALRTVGPTHALARAEAIARTNAHAEARAAFQAIAEHADHDDPAYCQALFGEGRSLYRARERAVAAERLDFVVAHCASDPEVVAQALYFAAKSYSALGQDGLAVARYDALAAHATEHRLTDDARYEAAAIELRAGDLDAARAHLRAVIDGPEAADMRSDALFLLGWTERRASAFDAALAAFDAALADGAIETREDLQGRAAYWRARTLADLGRADDARTAYETLARARPLSYYGRHARGRLAELGVTLAASPVADAEIRFEDRPALHQPGFARALAALRAGEVPLAERELEALGLAASGTDDEGRWLAVALLSHAGASERAVSRTRGTLVRGLLSRPLDERTRGLFALAYPRGFSEHVHAGAEASSVPPALVFGLIREESSFAPHAVSVAHAYGLMQLIRPTARRLARPLGLPSDPASLVRPDVNVTLGTRYLGELSTHYANGPEMIPPAYNAGQGAVDRWLRERGDGPLDEFVETIPYAETRGYTRRVIQSWGIYAFLETGRIEPLGRTLPAI